MQIIKPEHGRNRAKSMIGRAEFNKYIEMHGGFTCTRTRIAALNRFQCYFT